MTHMKPRVHDFEPAHSANRKASRVHHIPWQVARGLTRARNSPAVAPRISRGQDWRSTWLPPRPSSAHAARSRRRNGKPVPCQVAVVVHHFEPGHRVLARLFHKTIPDRVFRCDQSILLVLAEAIARPESASDDSPTGICAEIRSPSIRTPPLSKGARAPLGMERPPQPVRRPTDPLNHSAPIDSNRMIGV